MYADVGLFFPLTTKWDWQCMRTKKWKALHIRCVHISDHNRWPHNTDGQSQMQIKFETSVYRCLNASNKRRKKTECGKHKCDALNLLTQWLFSLNKFVYRTILIDNFISLPLKWQPWTFDFGNCTQTMLILEWNMQIQNWIHCSLFQYERFKFKLPP